MTPTPKQAKAEMQRRKENKVRKAKGDPPVKAALPEFTNASGADLKAWAEGK